MAIPTATPAPNAPTPLAVAEIARRIDLIFAALLTLIPHHARLLGALTLPLWTRLSRARQRLARLLARLAAGTPPRPPGTAPRHPSARVPAPGAALGRRHGWVVATLGYQAASLAAQLDHLLRQPGAAATLAASPGCARTLRPLCRMLGIPLPPDLRLPEARAPRKTAPRPPPPDKQGHPTPRPLPPYLRAAIRAWKRPSPKTA